MTAPFYPTGVFGEEIGFLVILVLGFFFGFFLERAGFGSARKLAGIFYFKDFAVLRVMFTGIVICMLGLLYLNSLGWIEWEAVNVPATYLGAQIVGGLLLGVGFIVGGYCPGTSIVAAASGKIDALFYIGGVLFGTAIFGLSFDDIQPLYMWGAQGVVYLSDYTGLASGTLGFLILLIALSAFAATELVDRRQSRPTGEGPRRWTLEITWQRAVAAGLVVMAFGLMSAQSIAGESSTKKLTAMLTSGENLIAATELDKLINDGKRVTVIDLRAPGAYAAYHVPGSLNLPMEYVAQAQLPEGVPVVLYSEHGTIAGQAWALMASSGIEAKILADGMHGWRREVLKEIGSEPKEKEAQPAGAAPPPPPATGIKIPIRRFKKGSSCS
jgi:uncharacterized protein